MTTDRTASIDRMAPLDCPAELRIERVRLYALRLPLRRPMVMAGSVIAETENLLVRIEASDGSEGWGEAASAPTMTGETLAGMVAAAQRLAPLLAQAPMAQLDAAQRRMDLALYGNLSVKSAIETAWLDAVGRATSRPVVELLRASPPTATTFDVQWMLGSGDAATDVAEAKERRAAGFRVFKVKVGGEPGADAERTRAIAEVLGSACLVSADANQAWTVAQALAYTGGLERRTIAFLEQPVGANDLDGMAEVAHRSQVPICSDEGIHGIRDLEAHHARAAAGGASLKPIKLGGLRASVHAALRCAELGMEVNLACKVGESGVSAAALLHVAAACPSVAWGLSLTNIYLLHDLVEPASRINGRAATPLAPGLGVEIDIGMLERYATAV